jgi:hypothetical protein
MVYESSMTRHILNPAPVADYIADMCSQLRKLAEGAGLEPLAILLSRAALEAIKQQATSGRTH